MGLGIKKFKCLNCGEVFKSASIRECPVCKGKEVIEVFEEDETPAFQKERNEFFEKLREQAVKAWYTYTDSFEKAKKEASESLKREGKPLRKGKIVLLEPWKKGWKVVTSVDVAAELPEDQELALRKIEEQNLNQFKNSIKHIHSKIEKGEWEEKVEKTDFSTQSTFNEKT